VASSRTSGGWACSRCPVSSLVLGCPLQALRVLLGLVWRRMGRRRVVPASGPSVGYRGQALNARQPLPSVPRRILVAGTSGSGKTTLARRIALTLGVPHTEIDALYHGPNWAPRENFMLDVAAFVSQPTWVTEWQYGKVRPLLLRRADLLVWLDLPRPVVMGRLVRRTAHRRLKGTALWNGNLKPPLSTFFTDRDHIVRWAWRTHHENAQRVAEAVTSRKDLSVLRLTRQREVDQWLGGPLRESVRPAWNIHR
jgi:adenylate kinase family enzyme